MQQFPEKMLLSPGHVLRRELRIDVEDTRSEMVRVSVIAYLGCVLTGLLSLSVAQWNAMSAVGASAVIAVASATGAGLWLARRRVPLWLLVVQAPYAALLLAVGLWAGGPDAASAFALFYVLVVLYGTFFLRTGPAAALIGFCSLTFAVAVIATGDPNWPTRVVTVFGASVTVGLFAGLLVKRVHERAARDSLTGLFNRRMWESLVQQELNKAVRDKHEVSMMLIDLDGFKAINDKYGHLHGDDVLKRTADTLRRVLRDADAPCRWGGDEFAVLLTDCDSQQVNVVADRLRRELGEVPGFSIGAATWRDGLSLDDLFRKADQSLYDCKAERGAV